MNYAVITGASSGLGREAARQLAREQGVDELWLIARRRERLEALAAEVTLPCRLFALDLCDESAWSRLHAELREYAALEHRLTWLVLAAGRGRSAAFSPPQPCAPADPAAPTAAPSPAEEYRPETRDWYSCLRLNCVALTALADLFLPHLRGCALLFASVAAFAPQPYFAVYAASKSYVLSLSRALNREYPDARLLAVCPNPVETEFFKDKELGDSIDRFKKIGLESAEKVVRTALRKVKRGRDLSVSCFFSKLIHVGSKILPVSWILNGERRIGLYPDEKQPPT